MESLHPDQFLGLPPRPVRSADVVLVSVPLEKTVSYGTGTWRAPRAILDASCQLELFDEETLIDFSEFPKIHTAPPVVVEGSLEDYLEAVRARLAPLRGKFVVVLGGEHTLTFAAATALVENPTQLTVVQIDAHADLIDQLDGRRWSHGTVMRRLWEQGCRLLQIGVRSLSRAEYELATSDERILTFFAHQLKANWQPLLDAMKGLEGDVYLTIDADGLDPSLIPQTGTPQPGGLIWGQTVDVIRTLTTSSQCRLVGADLVELVASPHPPGSDVIAAKLVAKLLAFWACGMRRPS